MSTSINTMKNFFNVLKLYANDTTTDGVAILDHAVSTISRFASLQDAVNHFLYDIASVTAATGNPLQSLYQNCGIVDVNVPDFSVDTGSASGYNTGNGIVKNAQDIVPENLLLTQVNAPASGSTTFHTYTGADGQTFSYAIQYPASILEVVDVATSPLDENGNPDSTYASSTYLQAGQLYSTLNDDNTPWRSQYAENIAVSIQTMMKGVENFWVDQSLKLIHDTYGLDFNGKTLTLKFGINQKSLAETGPIAGDVGSVAAVPANNIVMLMDSVIYTPIDSADPNGNTYVAGGGATGYVDRTIAHELVHATMQATGTMKRGMPEFFMEGVAELIHGIDDYCGIRSQGIIDLAVDSARLAAAVPFKEGTMTADAYPAGYMFMRYLLHQSLPTNVVIGNGAVPEVFNYAGGEQVVSGIASFSQVTTADNAHIVTALASDDDIIVQTTAGNLILRDVRGKVINFAHSTGNIYGHSYMATAAGTVDGRGLSGYEFISGANGLNNVLIAGDGGAELWGGTYGTDELFGGASADNFVTGVGCGNDTIYNAAANDRISIAATLDQITGTTINSGGVTLNFVDGSSVNVSGTVGAKFVTSNGLAFTANQSTGTWTAAQ